MILSAKMTVAQDYISCSSFADIGLNEKATNCFQILESKYISDPSFYFYYLRSQVNFRNAQSSEVLIQKYFVH